MAESATPQLRQARQLADTAVFLTSELDTNAVRFSPGEIAFGAIERGPVWLRETPCLACDGTGVLSVGPLAVVADG